MPARIDKLTPEQEARMPEWADRWIDIGLKTGRADRPRFEENIMLAYDKTKLARPRRVVWVESPLVLALAAPTAGYLIDKVRDAVDGATLKGSSLHKYPHYYSITIIRGAYSEQRT